MYIYIYYIYIHIYIYTYKYIKYIYYVCFQSYCPFLNISNFWVLNSKFALPKSQLFLFHTEQYLHYYVEDAHLLENYINDFLISNTFFIISGAILL